ncbi:MAG: HAD family hydrolase [Spirochaetes bacterium]|nr:HAD family hydrolase [Spirochaetota bacterium]
MKVFGLPGEIRALVFDMDGTLYTHHGYARFQESSQVARLAQALGASESEAKTALDRAREARRAQGLPRTSMANLFLGFGIDMATIVRWREEKIVPGDWLVTDQRLDAALALLQKRFRLALLTNNPRKVGEASLAALGVAGRFEFVVGLDDNWASKPAREPFLEVCARLGLEPSFCVSIGDREDVDLATALTLGMGAILVDGVEDVYGLPGILIS